MARIASDETKSIPVERWEAWSVSFTNGNRGRIINIEVVDPELGSEPLADQVVLVAIDHDPVGKGNDFIISYGDGSAPSRHVISAPVELWQAQDADGLVVSLEIEDEHGGHTIITLS